MTWKLLNETETCPDNTRLAQQNNHNHHMESANWHHQQCFMEDWQITHRQCGRPAPQNQTQDTRWPTRLIQRTLDDYMENPQIHSQQRPEKIGNNTTGCITPWCDHNHNEEGLGPRPYEALQRRDYTCKGNSPPL